MDETYLPSMKSYVFQQVEIINSSSVLSRPSFLIILRQQPCSGNNIFLSPRTRPTQPGSDLLNPATVLQGCLRPFCTLCTSRTVIYQSAIFTD